MASRGTPARAPLIEVFSSVQGEGSQVGVPMVFVRVAVCPIRCLYCDTPNSYTADAEFPAVIGPATRLEKNPVDAVRAAQLAAESAAASPFGRTEWVSLTGGEPLLYPEFTLALGHELRDRGLKLNLETAALAPAALRTCVAAVDHASFELQASRHTVW